MHMEPSQCGQPLWPTGRTQGRIRRQNAVIAVATDGLAEGAQPLVFIGVTGLMVNAPGVFHSAVGDMFLK
jgi:hypothetical protein